MLEASYSIFTAILLKMALSMKLNKENEFEKKRKRFSFERRAERLLLVLLELIHRDLVQQQGDFIPGSF